MRNELNELYEFAGFRLDPKTGTLWRDNEVVSLSPKSIELLKLLVSSGGRVVSKQEIFDTVWPDTFVEDGVLTQNIYTLRHTLGRSGGGQQFIETVPRRGYRFVGEVTVVPFAEPVRIAEDQNGSVTFDPYDDDALSAELIEERPADRGKATPSLAAVNSDAGTTAPRHRYFLLAILGALLLGAAGWGVYRFGPRGEASSEGWIAPIEQVRFQSLTDTGDIIHPTISPDGEVLAYVRVEENGASVWIQQIANRGTVQTLPPSRKGYRSLTFSPNGKYLYYRDEGDPGSIYQTPILGGTPKKVADNLWSDFSVSPDDRQFAFIRRDATRNTQMLVIANSGDGVERILGTRESPNGYRGTAPAWSPDGKKLAVVIGQPGPGGPVLTEIDIETGAQTEVKTPQFRDITRILWTPDAGQLIIAARLATEPTSQIWMLRISDGEMRRLTNDLGAYFWISLSADGRTLVTRQQRIIAQLWLLPDGDLQRSRQLTSGARTLDGYAGLAWMPDGKIVFSSRSGNYSDLFSMDPDTGQRTQLTSDAAENTWPVATRDGRYIVFVSSRSGGRAIWRMNSDGGNQKQLTFSQSPKEYAYAATPSPDSTEVFFIRVGAGPSSIWKTSMEGGNARQVLQLSNAAAESFLSVSPNGTWIAYRHVSDNQKGREEDGTMQIGIIGTDGSGEPLLFDVSQRRPVFHWTSNETLDYLAGTFSASAIWRQPLNGEPRKVVEFPDRVFNFAWSADAKNLVVSRGRLVGDAVMISNLP